MFLVSVKSNQQRRRSLGSRGGLKVEAYYGLKTPPYPLVSLKMRQDAFYLCVAYASCSYMLVCYLILGCFGTVYESKNTRSALG